MIELYINQLPNNNFNMNKSKKNECLNTLKEVKRVCKVVSFSAGGLLSPKKMPKEPKTSKLTEAQKVFLEIARKRQQYKNRGKA